MILSRHFLFMIALCSAFAPASAFAQALSAQECREIRDLYGLALPQCSAGEDVQDVAYASRPTQKDRESAIFFSSGGVVLDETAQRQIRQLAKVLETRTLRTSCLKLVGHSDTSGDAESNMKMGMRRAEAVGNMLVAQLRMPARIEIMESRGEERPMAGLAPDNPWQRRVQIWAKLCPAP